MLLGCSWLSSQDPIVWTMCCLCVRGGCICIIVGLYVWFCAMCWDVFVYCHCKRCNDNLGCGFVFGVNIGLPMHYGSIIIISPRHALAHTNWSHTHIRVYMQSGCTQIWFDAYRAKFMCARSRVIIWRFILGVIVTIQCLCTCGCKPMMRINICCMEVCIPHMCVWRMCALNANKWTQTHCVTLW